MENQCEIFEISLHYRDSFISNFYHD